MKKFLTCAFLGLACCMSFAACSDDNNPQPDPDGPIVESKYKRRVLVIDFTGSQCHPCAAMTSLLSSYMRTNPDQIVLLAAHLDIPAPDPLTNADSRALQSAAGINATPTVWVDCRQKLTQTVASTFVSMINNSLKNFPAICGIGINSTVVGSTVKAEVVVPFEYGSDCKICAVLVEDKIDLGENSVEGVYNHVVRKYATNPMGDSMGKCEAGSEYKHTFEFSTDTSWNLDNCHVVVYVFNSNNGNMYINNARQCPVGSSVDVNK